MCLWVLKAPITYFFRLVHKCFNKVTLRVYLAYDGKKKRFKIKHEEICQEHFQAQKTHLCFMVEADVSYMFLLKPFLSEITFNKITSKQTFIKFPIQKCKWKSSHVYANSINAQHFEMGFSNDLFFFFYFLMQIS